jgi:hypothetical protein
MKLMESVKWWDRVGVENICFVQFFSVYMVEIELIDLC